MVSDAIMEQIMVKVYNALIGAYSKLPAVNAHTATTMDTASFDALLNVIKSYGNPVIIGTPLAVQQIPLNFPAFPSEQDKTDIRNSGFVGMYKGASVVQIPNSYWDDTNSVKMFDEQYLFIVPSQQEKIVKVALEGGLITRENNSTGDWTVNFEAYQKAGVAVYAVNNIGIYKMTSLANSYFQG